MEYLFYIIHIAELIFFLYFGFTAFYTFLFGFAGLFPKRRHPVSEKKIRNFAVLIPGYKEDTVIVESAKDALNQNYPEDKYDIVVIADSFLPETIRELKKLPIKVIVVSFKTSTKAKALNKAIELLDSNYDAALILDADNLMEENFLQKINQAFEPGFKVIQGHRVAKNTNTPFAILDALSEEINNHVFRKGHRNLGLSSALIGSGMAFDYVLFKQTMKKIKAVGGFDKELELFLLKNKTKIEYLHEAYIMDEKIQKPEAFSMQRRRWLSAQFIFFRKNFLAGIIHLFLKGNIDFFDKTYQMILPPRVLLLGFSTFFTLIYGLAAWIDPEKNFLLLSYKEWGLVLFLLIFAFLFSIPKKFYNRKTFNALLTLPKAFFLMFGLLFKLKGANKKFIHTEHGTKKYEQSKNKYIIL